MLDPRTRQLPWRENRFGRKERMGVGLPGSDPGEHRWPSDTSRPWSGRRRCDSHSCQLECHDQLGDGSLPTICPGALLPFTPYNDLIDASPLTPPSGLPSPTCGHHIEKTSIMQPGGVNNVSATSAWIVNWTAVWPGGGAGGVVPVPLTSNYQQRIGELQVLVTPN